MSDAARSIKPVDRVIARMNAVYSRWTRQTTLDQMRGDWERAYPADVPGYCKPVDAGGVPAAWIGDDTTRKDSVILFVHGGGFRMGSIASHRDLCFRIARATGCRALSLGYRLAPEHPFPAALDDAIAAYRRLLEQGYNANEIVLAGDSAGGGLAVSLMVALREQGIPMPRAAVLLSPWVDLTASGDSYRTRAAVDPVHQRAMVLILSKVYLAGGDASDPRASPLFADLTGLPPLLIQAGDHETILDDAIRLVQNARAAGVDVTLDIAPDMIHVFQMYAEELAEARSAIADIGHFLARHLDSVKEPSR